jgi:hypothetical protein
MSNVHHAIYIPVPANIDQSEEFNAVTFDGQDNKKNTRFVWGANPKPGQKPEDAIAAQKAGFIQIAGEGGRGGSAADLLKRMNSKVKARGKQGYSVEKNIIYQSRRGGALSRLRNPDTALYVDSHGDSQTMGYRPYGLSPRELALLLSKHENLPKTIKTIKLFACYSGEAADTDLGVRTGEIYARQFSSFMSDFGYNQLTVYGYLGELIVRKNGQRISNTELASSGDYITASSARLMFIQGEHVVPNL